jgi:hypothetical protein
MDLALVDVRGIHTDAITDHVERARAAKARAGLAGVIETRYHTL